MTRPRRNFSPEFKLEAIQLHKTSGKSVRGLEIELGLSTNLLRQWLQKYERGGEAALRGAPAGQTLEMRLRELERENKRLRQEQAILKKALAIFTQAAK